MLPIHAIMHPTDFSDRSQAAFRLACSLARDYGSRLLLLHVYPPLITAYGDMVVAQPLAVTLHEIQEKLAGLRDLAPEVQIEQRVEEGDPITEILRLARESHCDLIVMGTHGRRGLSRLLLGSVAEGVLRRASCPVVTVKTPPPETVPAPAPASSQEPVKA